MDENKRRFYDLPADGSIVYKDAGNGSYPYVKVVSKNELKGWVFLIPCNQNGEPLERRKPPIRQGYEGFFSFYKKE